MEHTKEQKSKFVVTEIDLRVSEDNMKVYLTCHADFSKGEAVTDKIL